MTRLSYVIDLLKIPARRLRAIYRSARAVLGLARNVVAGVVTIGKPRLVSWRDFVFIFSRPKRYQPLVFPNGAVIPNKIGADKIDTRDKLAAVGLPDSFDGKTVLDIGCAEGFFTVQAALRGAGRAIGCDPDTGRLRVARIVARAWGLDDRVRFSPIGLFDVPEEWASDVVICFSLIHHFHTDPGQRRFFDTWKIVAEPERYATYLENMLRAVAKVASLTKEATYWEYRFRYSDGRRPDGVDHAALGDLWVDRGLYRRVEFLGLSQQISHTDRALYLAHK